MAGNLLEMCELTKRFGHGSSAQVAVDGISMPVGEGQVYGLLGSNGAGKSTMPKMVCGMSHPSTEQIRIDEHEWTRDDLYGIGSLIEQPPLYPNLTACKNLRILKETAAIRSTNRGKKNRHLCRCVHRLILSASGFCSSYPILIWLPPWFRQHLWKRIRVMGTAPS